MDQSFDARGIKAASGIGARGIKVTPEASVCLECGTGLRATGPGRRPVYCSRSCSSKAYRRRRAEGQQNAVADALIASRVETPDGASAGAQELLDVATGVQRAAARFLQNLETSRHSEADPRATEALDLLERSATAAVQRLLRTAHALRYEMLVARRQAEAAAAHGPTAGTGAGQATIEAEPTGEVDSSRVGSSPAVPSLNTTRDESSDRAADATPAGLHLVSPRVETPAAPAPVQRRPLHHRPATGGAPLRLALDAERTSQSPLGRGLGTPTGTWSAADGTLLVDGWERDPSVFAVRRPDGPAVGWVAMVGDYWGTCIDGRLVIDAADGQPWLSRDALDAVALLQMALDQNLA